ncbi:MAG: hypothetical protein KC503_12920 [Myxococcales bacterium]|nr:hypothetical protein [Myxococcales bacterium]
MPGKTRVLSTILIVFLIAAGCSGGEQGPPQPQQPTNPDPPQPPTNPDPTPDVYALTVVGWQNITAEQGQTITLQLRYTKNNQPEPNADINFRFNGDAKDTILSTYRTRTNDQGFAEAVMTAGQLVAAFKIEGEAPKAGPVTWTITVREKPEPPAKPLSFAGNYNLVSNFDIQGSFAGSKLASTLNFINDISNDPEDPGKFIVDKIFEQVNTSNQAIYVLSVIFKPALYVEVNKLLNSVAGSFITDVKQVAADLATITRRFEIGSEISTPVPQLASARILNVRHVLKRISWELHTARVDYTFQQLGLGEPVADGVAMTYNNSTDISIAQHSFDFKFGSFVLVALNNLIIPRIQQGAKSFGDLLRANINCQSVGNTINNAINIAGPAFWKAACDGALSALTTYVEQQIVDIDKDPTTLTIAGQSKLTDTNGDSVLDSFDQGVWTGSFMLSKSSVTIAGPQNKFFGRQSTTTTSLP